MSINLRVPASLELHPKITVFGVGGAGGNAVTNMIKSELEGVDFVVANTDAQALQGSKAERKIQMGAHITQGLGAGARPEVGRAAAEESLDEIVENLAGAHMVFITAGMGGGTGSGAAPVIAKAARDQGILTVGVVTKPFQFEGAKRLRIAESAIEELQRHVDTLIVIPNQNLFRIANEKTTFAEAFAMADEVLHCGVRGITDLMVLPGLINLDFADVRTVMNEMGKAMMGTGEGRGDKRAIEAAEAAISNPLLDEVSMKGARGVLINITGGPDMTLFEVDEAANRIRAEVDPDANIIVGSCFNPELEGALRVSVVATGIDVENSQVEMPLRPPARGAMPPPRMVQDVPPPVRSIEPVATQQAPRPVPLTQPLGSPQVRPMKPAPQPVNELIAQAREFASTSGAGYSSDFRISADVRSEYEPAADIALTRREPAQTPSAQAQQPPRPAPRKGMPGLLERVAQTGRFRSPGRPDDADATAEASEPAPQRTAPPKPAQAST
ncbi:MAG: cell division protein FtsZ, partial [Alphaproteobacteria bacterium]